MIQRASKRRSLDRWSQVHLGDLRSADVHTEETFIFADARGCHVTQRIKTDLAVIYRVSREGGADTSVRSIDDRDIGHLKSRATCVTLGDGDGPAMGVDELLDDR